MRHSQLSHVELIKFADAVRGTADKFAQIKRRLDVYSEMTRSGLILMELAIEYESERMLKFANEVLEKMRQEIKARPLFDDIKEEEVM